MSGGRDVDVVVVGSANRDFLARAPCLPAAGETVTGDLFQEGPGGKGANQAVGAARLGARVVLVARVGADAYGEELVAQLRREGVDTGHVVRDERARTGVALVHVDQRGRKSILVEPGANARLTVDDVRAVGHVVARAAVVLAQLEIPLPCVEEVFGLARGAGAQTILDPAPGRELSERLLGLVDIIRPNAHEAEKLTGTPVRDRRSAMAAARSLLRRGVGAVIVAAGAEGSLVLTRDEESWLPRLEVPTVDETGAGDAFCAALAVGVAAGRSLLEVAREANAAAALATTRLGAQAGLPTRAELLRFVPESPPPDELTLDGLPSAEESGR
jgi:ribokinase